MNAIRSWQAVLTELGSELAPCNTPGAAVHTPAAAVQGHRETEFYTPLPSAHSGTPVDAWHSILTTLSGDSKAANRRNADVAVSPGSRTSASPRARNSPGDSPSMVRQLFASAQRGTRQGPIASSPTHPKAFAVAAAEAPADKKHLPGSQSASAAAKQGGEAAARQAQCYHSSTGAVLGCSTASSPQQRGPSPGASDTQQLAGRITNLRASAESLLHSVSQASGPTGATALSLAAAQHASRSGSTQQDPLRALSSSSSTTQQDALLPRQLFQSPAQLRGPHSSPSTTRQRLLSPAHGSRGAAGAGGSQHNGSSTEAWQQGHAADTQGQEPLQQQLTGALRKVENLLAGMAQQQQQPTPRPHSNSSSRHGNHGLPLPAVSRPAGAIQQQQEQHMMLHHQHGAGQAQEQQQQVLQQLLLQQQQLLQQLMPLIPRADVGQKAKADVSTNAVGITAVTAGPQGLPQAALAAGLVQQQCNSTAASFTGSQGGSSLVASMQHAANAASTHLQGSNSSALGDVLQQQQHQASDGQTAAAALCRPGAMLVEELHQLQQTSVACVSNSGSTHTGIGSAEDGAGGGEGLREGLRPPFELVGAHPLAAEHPSSHGDNSSSIVQQLELNQGIQLGVPSAAADTAQGVQADTVLSSSSNGSGSGFRTCSSEGSGSGLQLQSGGGVPRQPQAQDGAAEMQLQHPGVSSWASNVQASTDIDANKAASSAEEEQLPETPTAALPRVHTPGKPAAETAAELSTPQLANSMAAIMTVSEAWRDESSSNQDKWQQLLAEWSAAEIDTWDDQRLTEQSAYWAGRESCHSGPGQQASRAGSSSQQQQQHSLPEQQQQHGLATANGHQQQQQPGGNMQDEGWQPEPEQQLQQQQWRQQVEEQEQEHEVSFVFRGEPSSSPERMPAAVAPGPATHSIPASTAGAGAGQAGSHACSTPAAAHTEQQQQQGWDQAGAAAQQQSPAWPDSTRKQLFASAGSTSTSSSRSDLELVLRPASQVNSAHGSKDDQADLTIHQQAAVSHTCSSQPTVLTSGVLAAAATAAATAAARGPQQAPDSSAADSPAAGATPRGQSSQQRQQQQQQQLGVDRLNRLMLDLRGLQQRLNTIQLQTPRHTTPGPGDTSQGSTPAGTARTATSTDSVLPAASALPPTGQLVTPAAAAASSLPIGGPGSGRAAAAAGRGGVVATPASAPVQYSAGVTSSGRAAASIALLKQRLQDSRAALQAIATPRQAEQDGPQALAPAGGAVQALQQAYSTTPRAATGAEQPAVQRHTPVAGSNAAGTGSGAALQAYSSPLLQPGSAAGGWGLQAAVPAGELPAGQQGIHGMSQMLGQGSAGIPASSAAPTAASDTAAAAATAALSAGGPLRSASAWLTGGSLQQYLDRSRRSSRASSTQASAGGAATPASAPSAADSPGQTDPNSHVQGLVRKWRVAAAATASVGVGAGPQQQQQQSPYGLSKAGHLGTQPQQQSFGSTHTTPRGLSPRWAPVPAAAAAGATGRTGSAVPAATGWLSNSMSASTHAPVGHSGSQSRPDTGAVLRGFAASPTAGLVSPPSLLLFDGSYSSVAAAGRSRAGASSSHGARQFTLPWPLSARGTQDTAASGAARGAALGMQYTPRNIVTPASGTSTANGSGGSRGDGSSTARSTGSALQGLHAPRGWHSSTPPSTSSLTQWVQQGSPTSQLKQRLRTAALQHQALQQQQEQQRVALESPAAAALARNLATVDRTLAGLHSAPLVAPRRETALAARQQGAGLSSGHRPNTGPHGNSSGSNMAQAARSPSAVLAATAAAAEAAKSSLSGDAARARAARSTSPLQKLRMQQEALAMSSSAQLQGQRNPVVPVGSTRSAAAARMPLAASYSTVALAPQR